MREEEAVETFEGRHGLRAYVVHDDEPRDVRREWDHLATIHEPEGWGDEELRSRYGELDLAEIIREKRFAGSTILPLRSSDYGSSGGTIYVCDVDDANGYAEIAREKIAEAYGSTDESARRRARSLIASEVDELDAAIQGYVFGYVVEDAAGEHIDSCWGFIDRDMSYVKQEARDALKYAETAAEHEEEERRAMEARDIVTAG